MCSTKVFCDYYLGFSPEAAPRRGGVSGGPLSLSEKCGNAHFNHSEFINHAECDE
jgi:hypothetical protein